MAIRGLKLSNDILKRNEAENGFDLKFTPGIEYNLDELVAAKDRANSGKPLLVEVSNEKIISAAIANNVQSELSLKIETNLNTKEILQEIMDIVSSVHTKNKDADLETIRSEINREIRVYMGTLKDKFPGKVIIKYNGNSYTPELQYVVLNKELEDLFVRYYNLYAADYNKKIEQMKEGGLLLMDIAPSLGLSEEDCKKYLFDSKYDKKKEEKQFVNDRRPVFVWTDGTVES